MARIALMQNVLIEYMGFMYLSSYLQERGHTIEMFIENAQVGHDIFKDLVAFEPDIVGFSVITTESEWALEATQKAKEKTGAVVVWGNVHAIANPDIIESPYIDVVCLGEGEEPLAELALRIDEGRDTSEIPGLWVKVDGQIHKNAKDGTLTDLDDLPYHDRNLYDKYSFFRNSPVLRFCSERDVRSNARSVRTQFFSRNSAASIYASATP